MPELTLKQLISKVLEVHIIDRTGSITTEDGRDVQFHFCVCNQEHTREHIIEMLEGVMAGRQKNQHTETPQPLLSTAATHAAQLAINNTEQGQRTSVAVVRGLLQTISRFRAALTNVQQGVATTYQFGVMSHGPGIKRRPYEGYSPNEGYGTLGQAKTELQELEEHFPEQEHILITRQAPTEWKPLP